MRGPALGRDRCEVRWQPGSETAGSHQRSQRPEAEQSPMGRLAPGGPLRSVVPSPQIAGLLQLGTHHPARPTRQGQRELRGAPEGTSLPDACHYRTTGQVAGDCRARRVVPPHQVPHAHLQDTMRGDQSSDTPRGNEPGCPAGVVNKPRGALLEQKPTWLAPGPGRDSQKVGRWASGRRVTGWGAWDSHCSCLQMIRAPHAHTAVSPEGSW